jgi:tetratricopeptide (TPR) repeat protein
VGIAAVAWIGLLAGPAGGDDPGALLDRVRKLRLRGELVEAQSTAERGLASERASAADRVRLHLELARIHDRHGLHQNRRPVAAVLDHVEKAEALAGPGAPASLKGAIELVKAMHYYRADGAEAHRSAATRHAQEALRLFEQAADGHGAADAVHQLGLIHLMRRELGPARELFDRSLRLDDGAGSRAEFRGDYERHVGFVHTFAGNGAAAIPFLERSLRYRQDAEALDASLFAAEALGAALVDAGRGPEARPLLLQALLLAERFDSPVGRARTGMALGRMYEALNDGWSAALAYEMARRAAVSVSLDSIAGRAREALESLAASARAQP